MIGTRLLMVFIILSLSNNVIAQPKPIDSLNLKATNFNYKVLIIPASLITYGVIGLDNGQLDLFNKDLKKEVKEHIDKRFTIDDVTQYSPIISVYALNALKIKGENNFRDRTILISTAYVLMGVSVNILKASTHIRRPDSSSSNSFPSGHTATAFMGAEFLHQEYKDSSIWYSIAGYSVAAGTGLFRIYNNRHWLTDVAAGAGIGMLCTKAAYWLHPHIKRLITKREKSISGIVLPFYSKDSYGLSLSLKL